MKLERIILIFNAMYVLYTYIKLLQLLNWILKDND